MVLCVCQGWRSRPELRVIRFDFGLSCRLQRNLLNYTFGKCSRCLRTISLASRLHSWSTLVSFRAPKAPMFWRQTTDSPSKHRYMSSLMLGCQRHSNVTKRLTQQLASVCKPIWQRLSTGQISLEVGSEVGLLEQYVWVPGIHSALLLIHSRHTPGRRNKTRNLKITSVFHEAVASSRRSHHSRQVYKVSISRWHNNVSVGVLIFTTICWTQHP